MARKSALPEAPPSVALFTDAERAEYEKHLSLLKVQHAEGVEELAALNAAVTRLTATEVDVPDLGDLQRQQDAAVNAGDFERVAAISEQRKTALRAFEDEQDRKGAELMRLRASLKARRQAISDRAATIDAISRAVLFKVLDPVVRRAHEAAMARYVEAAHALYAADAELGGIAAAGRALTLDQPRLLGDPLHIPLPAQARVNRSPAKAGIAEQLREVVLSLREAGALDAIKRSGSKYLGHLGGASRDLAYNKIAGSSKADSGDTLARVASEPTSQTVGSRAAS